MNKQDREAQARLIRMGIDPDDAYQLHLIERRLHRWHELECGIDRGGINWNDDDGKPYWYISATGKTSKTPMYNSEKAALKKLAGIMAKYPSMTHYVQGDPRGGALYIIPKDKLRDGMELGSYYSSVGVCV